MKEYTQEEKYQLLADCIRSGQVDSKELHQEFERDPNFKEWYIEKYIK